MYLLDTPIVFELRRARAGEADPGLAAWAASVARERLFLSAISLVELEATIERTTRHDKTAGAALRSWLDVQLLPAFEGHILALDAAVARRRGQLALVDTRDALFAATALEHGLTLVTRNLAAFKGTRVKLFDPRDYRASDEEDTDWRTAVRSSAAWLRNPFVRS
ncbi:type II toxin-antitoxin system VapC family toxin [Sphingomonas psychrotolerans]|uniref:Ribonuclease VapC n=1 Tax=Sphingomonas psychrotolerans TaxID=1327635 RepID=A0A2K8MC30_9SPHN|nr:type II toxin-antitoxin system VapC family toxin [Sphingomonas psychrotolerans]ATY31445.1 VapC toxin family PIN domain ribonuclease [Sphingomonas psychrotolerans]